MKEFFARLNPTERRFVVGVGVVFFLVLNFVFVWPHFWDWGQTSSKMDEARKTLLKFETGTNDIPALENEIKKYQRGGESVPPENQAVQFFRLIQNQAAQSGVAILSMGNTRQAGTNNLFFVEQNQTITGESGEKQLVNFLYALGTGTSLIRVRDLSIQPDAPRQKLTSRLTLIASYRRNAPAARGATETAKTTPSGSNPATAPKPVTPAAQKPAAPKPGPASPATTPNPLLPRPGAAGFPGQPARTNALKSLTPNKK